MPLNVRKIVEMAPKKVRNVNQIFFNLNIFKNY